MATRSIWNGTIRCGKLALKVKLHSAVEDRTVRFHLLHDQDKQRVRQRLVNPDTGEEISQDEVRRGFQVEPGVFVVLEEADLAKLEPESSKEIEILRFVPFESRNFPWYERPYYVAPDGDADDYFALVASLEKSGIPPALSIRASFLTRSSSSTRERVASASMLRNSASMTS